MPRSDVAPGPEFDYKPGVNSRVQQPRESEELLLLGHLFALEPERSLRKMPGRLTLLTRLEGERVVVKRFEGGAGREGWREKILGQRVRSQGRREFEILTDLAAVGIPVPRALRFVENRSAVSLGLFGAGARGQSAVLMECVEHFEDARGAIERLDRSGRAQLARDVLAIVRRLHERGWFHRDLYLQHFLIPCAADRPLVLIDVARARWSRSPARRWLVKDLAALQLSAPKSVTRTERLRFLRGWLEGQGVREQNAWKRWARDVAVKAERLGAHRPKFEDEEQVVGVEPERTLPGKPGLEDPTQQAFVDHE